MKTSTTHVNAAVDARITEIAEISCSETISTVVATMAARTKIHGVHLALAVPGACHDHPPTTDVVEGCAYCERNGNVFAAERDASISFAAKDVVAAYVHEVRDTLRRLAEHVDRIVTTHRRGTKTTNATDVDDLETQLLEALLS